MTTKRPSSRLLALCRLYGYDPAELLTNQPDPLDIRRIFKYSGKRDCLIQANYSGFEIGRQSGKSESVKTIIEYIANKG
jgi:hypothetical protein